MPTRIAGKAHTRLCLLFVYAKEVLASIKVLRCLSLYSLRKVKEKISSMRPSWGQQKAVATTAFHRAASALLRSPRGDHFLWRSTRGELVVCHLCKAAYEYRRPADVQRSLDESLPWWRWAKVVRVDASAAAVLVRLNVWGWRRDVLCFGGSDCLADCTVSWAALAVGAGCPFRTAAGTLSQWGTPYAAVGHSLGGQAAEVFGVSQGVYWYNVNGPSTQAPGATLRRWYGTEYERKKQRHGELGTYIVHRGDQVSSLLAWLRAPGAEWVQAGLPTWNPLEAHRIDSVIAALEIGTTPENSDAGVARSRIPRCQCSVTGVLCTCSTEEDSTTAAAAGRGGGGAGVNFLTALLARSTSTSVSSAEAAPQEASATSTETQGPSRGN